MCPATDTPFWDKIQKTLKTSGLSGSSEDFLGFLAVWAHLFKKT